MSYTSIERTVKKDKLDKFIIEKLPTPIKTDEAEFTRLQIAEKPLAAGSFAVVHDVQLFSEHSLLRNKRFSSKKFVLKILPAMMDMAEKAKILEGETKLFTKFYPDALGKMVKVQNQTCILQEKLAGTNMADFLGTSAVKLKDEDALKIAASLTGVVKNLAENRIVHLDLRLANLLLDEETLQVQVCDFGRSLIIPEESPDDLILHKIPKKDLKGSHPSESYDKLSAGLKTDLYMVAPILEKIFSDFKFPDKTGEHYEKFIKRMKHEDHAMRPSAMEVDKFFIELQKYCTLSSQAMLSKRFSAIILGTLQQLTAADPLQLAFYEIKQLVSAPTFDLELDKAKILVLVEGLSPEKRRDLYAKLIDIYLEKSSDEMLEKNITSVLDLINTTEYIKKDGSRIQL